MRVKEVMNKAFVVDKDIGLREAARLMSSKKIGCLLYIEKNKIKGIITESDLVREFWRKSNISQAMSKNVISIAPNDDLDSALEIMKDNKIKRLPVIEKGSLVGMVTMTDLMAYADEIEAEFLID